MKFARSSVARAEITHALEVAVHAVLYGALRERKERTFRLGKLKRYFLNQWMDKIIYDE